MGLKLIPCINRHLFGTGESLAYCAAFAVHLLLLAVVLGKFNHLPPHPTHPPLAILTLKLVLTSKKPAQNA